MTRVPETSRVQIWEGISRLCTSALRGQREHVGDGHSDRLHAAALPTELSSAVSLRAGQAYPFDIAPPRPAPPRPLQELECLQLNRNEITSIFPGAFVSLTRLTSLELKGNLITMITGADFGDVPRLRQLQLQNNRLIRIETGAFSAMKLLESM